ncbi:MAG TPA: hypothetical protein VJN72_06285 [Gaiellales bacterium]|nr:hypothetical protein [Gaiellales bacterium]
MAYPPAALPVNRTNATPQTNTHPNDHNLIGQAINDVVGKLGTNPSGQLADVTTRFAFEGIASTMSGGTDQWSTFGGFNVQAGTVVGTTDASGYVVVTFPHPFPIAPIVIATNGDCLAAPDVYFSLYLNANDRFSALAHHGGGSIVGNGSVRVNWIAIGPKS